MRWNMFLMVFSLVMFAGDVVESAEPVIKEFGEAPKTFRVKFETSKGDFVMEVTREWSPNGADQIYNLVQNKFYDDCRFFRVLDRFMAQIGINGDPEVHAVWRKKIIKDDKVTVSNKRGYVSFAMAGPNTRTTQIFFNYGNNANLDGMGFSPFGRVIEGMDVVDKLYNGYGEGAPQGRGPSQGLIQEHGNKYLNQEFPKLDYIKKATLVRKKSSQR